MSAQRRAGGERLARQVEAELADLKMSRARFGVAIEQAPRPDGVYLPDGRRVACDATGVDQVEFLISANPGEPLKPMARVASGGETARLMLALKSTLAHADATPTLIFDEIDQGIGGRVGAVVGQKLWLLTGDQRTNDQGEAAPARPGARLPCHPPGALHYAPASARSVRRSALHRQQAGGGRSTARSGRPRWSAPWRATDRIDELTQMLGTTGEAGRRSVEELLREVALVKQGVKQIG